MRLLTSITERFKNWPDIQKILANTGWLFVDRIIRLGVGLLVGVWIARYLGPEQFGLLNYASAFVAIFGAIAGLGLNGIVVRDLVKEPEASNTTIGTAFVLLLFGGLLAFAIAFFAIQYVRPNDSITQLVVAILGFAMVFKASDVVKYWFESQVQSKYTVWVQNTAFLISAGIKVVLVINHAPLIHFVWVVLIEAALACIALFGVYIWQRGKLIYWCFKIKRAKRLLLESWPLVLSGLAVMIYMRIDQIMLGQMLGDKEVGLYTAAVRICEVWYFIPMSIIVSVYPSITSIKNQNERQYYQKLQALYDLIVIISFLIAIPIVIFSHYIIYFLFGPEYKASEEVLRVYMFIGVFASLSVASGRWMIDQGYTLLALKRNGIGVIINILLNYYLIPLYGIIGSAYSTLISFAVAAYISDILSIKTRKAFFQKTKAIFLLNNINYYSKLNRVLDSTKATNK